MKWRGGGEEKEDIQEEELFKKNNYIFMVKVVISFVFHVFEPSVKFLFMI